VAEFVVRYIIQGEVRVTAGSKEEAKRVVEGRLPNSVLSDHETNITTCTSLDDIPRLTLND
jgi:hypothetical protein